ncbi:MAG: DUF3857 domain-containing protein, partial [Bacteroidota bacterium]|nr:DUF3857 domain-containing protein [Bacteroidota bacterium]
MSFSRYYLPLLLLAAPAAYAQTPASQLLTQMRQQYPNEKAVYLEMRQDLTVEIRNDSVQVVARHHADMLHLAEQSGMYANDRVFSSHFNRLQKLEARTLVPNGEKFKAVKVNEFKDKFEIQSGIFFDDTRSVSFSFPAVTPGARTETDYTVRHVDARFVMPFFVGSYVPVRHAELTITVPKGVVIGYKTFHAENTPIKYTREEKGSQVVYRWTADNLPSPPRENDGPQASYYLPHIVFFVQEAPV